MPVQKSVSVRPIVIFDFDGTLADTKAAIIDTAKTVLLEWGIDEQTIDERVGRLIGPPFPQAYEEVFGMTAEDAIEVTERYRRIYNYLGVTAWPVFDGVPELLKLLRAGGKTCAVASSKRTPLVMRGLEDNGVCDAFAVVCAKEADAPSTKADAIRNVLQALDANPKDAVMVGDRFHDVEAALACGIPCIGVLYGNTAEPGELEAAGAAVVVQTVDELAALLLG